MKVAIARGPSRPPKVVRVRSEVVDLGSAERAARLDTEALRDPANGARGFDVDLQMRPYGAIVRVVDLPTRGLERGHLPLVLALERSQDADLRGRGDPAHRTYALLVDGVTPDRTRMTALGSHRLIRHAHRLRS